MSGRFKRGESSVAPRIPAQRRSCGISRPNRFHNPPDSMVDQIVDGLWIAVERRHRRRDDEPIRLRASIFCFQVDVVQRCFAGQQNKAAPLLVCDIGRKRVISASAAPKRMADSVFMLRGDHHAVVARGAAGDRRRLVVARMMDRGYGCDLAGREPGLLEYRCLGPAADAQMAFGAQSRERGEQANAVSGAGGTRYRHYDPHFSPRIIESSAATTLRADLDHLPDDRPFRHRGDSLETRYFVSLTQPRHRRTDMSCTDL